MTEPIPFSIERIAPSAASYMRRLPRHRQEAIAEAFDYLCNVSPFRHTNPTVIRPLKGKYKGLWRYRVGDIRIIYEVEDLCHFQVLVRLRAHFQVQKPRVRAKLGGCY